MLPRRIAATVLLVAGVLAATLASAQPYPARPIRMIVPFAPGGGADTLARPLAERMRQRLGQPVLPENRSGASSNIGTDLVAKAAPDGYTLLINTDGIALYPHLFANLPYDPFRDLVPITFVAETPMVLASNPTVPATDLKGLVALARKEPGKLAFANPGQGAPHHLAFELFAREAGVQMTQAVYRGGGPALQDVLAGHAQVGMFTLGAVSGHIAAGKLRPYAVMTARRSQSSPDIPTMAEAGLPNVQANLRFVVMAPRGTPPEIVRTVHAAITDSLKEPELREQLQKQGFEVLGTSAEETGRTMRADHDRWGPLLKAINLKLD
jgi:tripartite-type tricarboxylate transporter receptor subunit TctC